VKLNTLINHPFSLAFKYATMISILIALSMGSLTYMMIYSQSEQNTRYTNSFGQIITKQLASTAVEPLFADQDFELEVLVNRVGEEEQIVGAAIYSHDGEKIVSYGQLPAPTEINFDKPYYSLGNTWRFDYALEPQLVVHTSPVDFKGVTAGFALVVFSNETLNEQFAKQLKFIIIMAIFLFLVVIGASIFLGKRLSRPITSLVNAASDIQSGKIGSIDDRRNDEIGLLINAINSMGSDLLQKSQVEGLLNKFLTKDVAHKVMHQLDPVHMAGEHVYATVLFADIVGFTSISEKISPEEVQKLLNEYYGYFNNCAKFYFGTVDKFIGDCVMVVFGVPKEDPKHQYNAVSCALLMQEMAKRLNERRKEQGMYPIELRIGINSGKMLAGLVGSEERMEYTVVGDAVNLASRLCSEAEGSETIIEQSLYDTVNPNHALTVNSLREIRVRGKEEPVKIYSVHDIKHPYPVVIDNLISDVLSTNAESDRKASE
jgi:adenylate cyclase